MAGMVAVVKRSLALKMSLVLAVLMVVLMGIMAIWITAQRTQAMEDNALKKAQLAANLGAQMYSTVLNEAIDNGILSVTDVFEAVEKKNYQLIEGYNWGDNPKYHTKFDAVTDKAVLVFQDKFLEDPDFVFAIGVDKNGYLPTHNTKYQKPVTGDPKKDLAGNRSKRIFDDPTGKAAAENEKPGFVQVYHRDTGVVMWDVSSPIYVKGKHWGGFRVALSMERIDRLKTDLQVFLFLIFGGFTILVIGAIFILVKRAMKPVEDLTASADSISMGEALDVAITPKTKDEIGRLTKSLDRLRSSMKAAMERLGE